MRMGYRTQYQQPTQHQYYPNRFGAYAGGMIINPAHMRGLVVNPTHMGGMGQQLMDGLKTGNLDSYALPAGMLIGLAPLLLKKQIKNKKVKKAMYVGGALLSVYSLAMAYMAANPKV